MADMWPVTGTPDHTERIAAYAALSSSLVSLHAEARSLEISAILALGFSLVSWGRSSSQKSCSVRFVVGVTIKSHRRTIESPCCTICTNVQFKCSRKPRFIIPDRTS